MQASIRVARLRAPRAFVVSQRRVSFGSGKAPAHIQLLATPPSGPLVPPTPPPPSGAAPVRPVVVTSVPITPGTTTLPPPPPVSDVPPIPPPPPPRKPRRLFRRTLIYTSLGLLIFYPVSGWLSTQYEAYREFFVSTFPGGEALAEYADEHGWETFGYGTVSKKAVEGWQNVTGGDKPNNTVDRAKAAGQDLAKRAEEKAKAAKAETERKAAEAKAKLEKAKDDAAKRAKALESQARTKAGDLKKEAERKAESVKADAKGAAADIKSTVIETTQTVQDKAKELAAQAKEQVSKATAAIPFNASEGIEGIVREAEKALGTAKDKTESAAEKVKNALTPAPYNGPRILPDTQRPRELRPETVVPQKPNYEGQEKYSGTLPLGFEPPPGYYIPPPPKAAAEPAKPTLPLLGPKVKEFASEEPIISQLASTIDSLTSSLSTPTGGRSADASGILSKAQDDLTALSARLSEVKKLEKQKLEEAIGRRTAEFDSMLRSRDAERAQSEAGLRDEWTKERQTMVDEWKSAMDKELSSQREGIEKRLHEEVVSQGIELQRRWLRSIKSQVETERGGRLAKLDSLSSSLKQLERITLDNSATLDDNVRLHKVWSALRAVQSKVDNGDIAFDDEVRALKAISSPVQGESAPAQTTIISATLNQLEKSGIPQTGVKSFAALSSWFSNSVSPRVQSASLVPAPEQATVVSHLASRALSGLMFRPKAGLVEGDDVSAILARAEWCLGEKDLDGAAREVNRLRGWPGRLAADWLREARRTLEVRQALEVVGTEATLASLLLV